MADQPINVNTSGNRASDLEKFGRGVTTPAAVKEALRIQEQNRRAIETGGSTYRGDK